MEKLRIFAASPSDMAAERARVGTVAAMLKPLADALGIVLDVVDWRSAVPDMGRPEQVILEQLRPTEWDVFVGVLWHRFGTPPGGRDERARREYLSGTEEEFKAACRLWKQHGRPRVMIYRCTRPVPPDELDPRQFEGVRYFFAQFEAVGGEHPGLYQSFDTPESFERLLLENLQCVLLGYKERLKGAPGGPPPQPREEKTSPRHSSDTTLHAACAYASLLSFVLGPLLVLLGLLTNNELMPWLLSGGVVLLLGFGYLYWRYQSRVKWMLVLEGVAPRPKLFWTTLADRITHEKTELSAKESVMVLAPPGARDEAERLKEIYNRGEQGEKLLLFHCLARPADGVAREQGDTLYGQARPPEALPGAMKDCSALVLLDDATWGDYPQTKKAVVRWSVRNTVRPILAVKVGGGGGSLIYSDCRWEDVAKADERDQPLLSLLLTQADNRAEKWRQQATIRRRLVIGFGATTFVLLLVLLAGGFLWWQRLAGLRRMVAPEEHARVVRDLQALRRVTDVDPNEHMDVARALAAFRSAAEAPSPEPFRLLLTAHAKQFQRVLEGASGHASPLHVILFAVIGDQSRVDGVLTLREVAATRDERTIPFEVRRGTNIEGMVGCAVAERAFVLWEGESRDLWARTDNIVAWDLRGHSVPDSRFLPAGPGVEPGTPGLKLGASTCTYKTFKDDERRRMLCAPVGMDDAAGQVTGAVCVSAGKETDFLTESWVRHAILHFGNSLSFASWEAALQKETSPAASKPARSRGRGAR